MNRLIARLHAWCRCDCDQRENIFKRSQIILQSDIELEDSNNKPVPRNVLESNLAVCPIWNVIYRLPVGNYC